MASFALAFTRQITLRLQPVDWPDEVIQYGFHTEEADNPADIAEQVQQWWQLDLSSAFKASCNLATIAIAQWDVTLSKWVTEYQRIYTPPVTGGGGVILPPQCALVISQQTSDIPVPLGDGSRRNRSYIGYLNANNLALGGVYNTASVEGLADQTVLLDTRLQGIARVAPVGRGGLCVTSVQEGLSGDTAVFRVGRVVDTQRRRRNAIQENYVTRLPV